MANSPLLKQTNMENNRRSFFKGLATFVSGVVAAKVASYTPKKEEPKEELLVSSAITLVHDGKEFHPLVLRKTENDGMEYIKPSSSLGIAGNKPKIRKANI